MIVNVKITGNVFDQVSQIIYRLVLKLNINETTSVWLRVSAGGIAKQARPIH